MIELLPKWNLHGNRPSFYDADSVTLLELASKLHGVMNELIADYNKFVDEVNTKIENFVAETKEDQEVFETALRQEFQDFIDIINIKVAEIENAEKLVDSAIEAKIPSIVDQVIEKLPCYEGEVIDI